MDPTSIAKLTAMVTLIASGVAALAAVGVAAINAWSGRRQSLETSQRSYRQSVAKTRLRTHAAFGNALRECMSKQKHPAQSIDVFLGKSIALGTDAYLTGDPYLDRALKLAARFRRSVGHALSEVTPSVDAQTMAGLFSSWTLVGQDLSAALQQAAEGYIYDSSTARAAATVTLDQVEAELKAYSTMVRAEPPTQQRIERAEPIVEGRE